VAVQQFLTSARSPQPVWPLVGAIWFAGFLVSIDYTALNVALPTSAEGFAAGTSAVSWGALVYMLVIVALTPVTGHAIARVGSRPALVGGLVAFAVASLASAAAPNLALLVALRALQRIGASVMFVIGPAMIKTELPQPAQDRAFAVYSTGPTAGLCAGPAIGGQLTSMFGWHAVFLFDCRWSCWRLPCCGRRGATRTARCGGCASGGCDAAARNCRLRRRRPLGHCSRPQRGSRRACVAPGVPARPRRKGRGRKMTSVEKLDRAVVPNVFHALADPEPLFCSGPRQSDVAAAVAAACEPVAAGAV
jgi:hypothetical protein